MATLHDPRIVKNHLYARLHVDANQVMVSDLGIHESILFVGQCDPIVAAKEFADHYGIGEFDLYVTTDDTVYIRSL